MSQAFQVARDELRSFIERLEEEKAAISGDIKDVKGEAKGRGYDVTAINAILKLRKKDANERMEQEAILETYMVALGMIDEPSFFDEPYNRTTGEVFDDRPATPSVGVSPATDTSLTTRAPFQQSVVVDERPPALVHTNSEIAPASDGEAEAPATDERKSPGFDDRSGEGANAGGDHEVTAPTIPTEARESVSPVRAHNPVHYEIVPPVPMKAMPFAHCFPELSKDAYQALVADIEANGVIEPIVRLGDMIVDGWSRYNAARHLGIKYPVVFYTGDDALIDAIGWQRSSRDWTPAQEAKVAAALAKHLPHRADDIWAAFHIALGEDREVVSA